MFDAWGIYRGYVDDERNTDNAWVETVAILIRVDERFSKEMRSFPSNEGGSRSASPTKKDELMFEWVDLCMKGEKVVDASELTTSKKLLNWFPGHRDWIWCVRNYFAGGSKIGE